MAFSLHLKKKNIGSPFQHVHYPVLHSSIHGASLLKEHLLILSLKISTGVNSGNQGQVLLIGRMLFVNVLKTFDFQGHTESMLHPIGLWLWK